MMLKYQETTEKIWEIEKTIKKLESMESISMEQREYLKHLRRLLGAYYLEHRKAARKDDEYAIR